MLARQLGPIEAREYANALARRRRLWNPPNAVVKEPPLHLVEAPRQLVLCQQDAHVITWKLHIRVTEANTPLEYLRRRCRELNLPYEEIIGSKRQRRHVQPRHELMLEMHTKFKLSLTKIGLMFGGRDHTTVMEALRKYGREPSPPIDLKRHSDEIKTLWDAGVSQSKIGAQFNASQAAISSFAKRQGWQRP